MTGYLTQYGYAFLFVVVLFDLQVEAVGGVGARAGGRLDKFQ